MNEPKRLLIIACSATKVASKEAIAAIDLYDGPSYRILRPRMAAGLVVLIISAEHGAIDASEKIGNYDRLMTPDRAEYLKKAGKLARLEMLLSHHWDKIHVHAGKNYRGSMPMEELIQAGATVCSGGIGTQLGQLKSWLERKGV